MTSALSYIKVICDPGEKWTGGDMAKYDPDESYIIYLMVISYASLKSAEAEFQLVLIRVTFPPEMLAKDIG